MRDEPIQQIEHGGHLINVYVDDDARNPREDSNLGTMYTSHRHYCAEKELKDHFDMDEVFKSRWEFSERFLREYVALPVYMYDHGGQTVSTRPFSCPWDSGLYGIIAVPVAKVKAEYGWRTLTAKRRQTVEEYLRSEVKEFDNYLTGQVYGYQITRVDGDGDDIIESCWGYYGADGLSKMEAECKAIIDKINSEEAIRRVVNYWRYAIQLSLPFGECELQTL